MSATTGMHFKKRFTSVCKNRDGEEVYICMQQQVWIFRRGLHLYATTGTYC